MLKRLLVLNQFTISISVIILLAIIVCIIIASQRIAEEGSLDVRIDHKNLEVAKLAAEVKQIRSDTSGSLFWLKLIALFVTVGGAVGGYLIGQSKLTQEKIKAKNERNEHKLNFDHRKDVDAAFQAIIQELSSKEPILRASSAVKFGSILRSFPVEWNVSNERKVELIELTKQVLAASLSIEENDKVLKTISIAIVLHKPHVGENVTNVAEVIGVDLSGAKAVDAYWARVNFSYSDFYKANLIQSSFRHSILKQTQFREAIMRNAVFINSDCESANFKLADLRGVDFSNAHLLNANFEEAKVYGINLKNASLNFDSNVTVDASEKGDGTNLIKFSELLDRCS